MNLLLLAAVGVIRLSPGENFVDPARFTVGPDRSGLVIEGAADGSSVLSGARPLPDGTVFRAIGKGVFAADFDAGDETPDQFYVKGRPYWMARYPNRNPGGGRNVYDVWKLDQIHPRSDLPDALAKARTDGWAHPEDGIVHAMHAYLWGDIQLAITGRAADGSVVLRDGGQNARPSAPHPVYRFVENIREELDAPGEWFYDRREKRLYAMPLPGDDLSRDPVRVGAAETLVAVRGTAEKPVRDVTIRNVTFRHAARTFFASREPVLRSDWTIHRGAALELSGAANCRVENCTFEDVGGNAVLLDGYVDGAVVTNCLFRRIGASAVVIAGRPSVVRDYTLEHSSTRSRADIDATPGPKGPDYPRDCTVVDCLMTDLGREEKQVAGVTVDIAARITVKDCTIARVPRAGVNIGDGCFGGHLVTGCDVFDTVLETGDHGAFNSWGRDRFWTNDLGMMDDLMETLPALVSADNVQPSKLIDNRWRCDHGWDIDLDDGSSFYQIVSNVCLRGGLKLREGFRRTARDNFCLNNGLHPHCWLRTGGDVVEDNVFFALPAPAGRADYINPDMTKNTLVRPGEEGRFPVPVRRWGVRSPRLRALAPSVEIPVAKSVVPVAVETPAERRTVDGMTWRRFDGKREFSAYGITPDHDGWILEKGAKAPFRENDILDGDLPEKFVFPVSVTRPHVGALKLESLQ